MQSLSKTSLPTALLLAVPLALAPAALTAQEPTQEAPQCTATVSPTEVHAGEAAIQINTVLSENIGPIVAFEGPEESGLTLAVPTDIPRADMANPEEEVQPIVMTPETNGAALWISTAEVTPGEFEVTLRSEEGTCTAQLTVIETP